MLTAVMVNSSVDKTMWIDGFSVGREQRVQELKVLPGGKGINVARAARTLEEQVRIVGFTGGHSGRLIEEGLDAEGLTHRFVHVPGESRTCLAILDPVGHSETIVNEQGPLAGTDAEHEFYEVFREEVRQTDLVTLSGSLLPGLSPDFYVNLMSIARSVGVPCILDTSGDVLTRSLASRPLMVKPNVHEAADATGLDASIRADAVRAAKLMRGMGPLTVCVTVGSGGALLANADGVWTARPPRVDPADTVGCGDCFVAGYAAGWLRKLGVADTLRLAVAAAAANALSLGAGVFRSADVEFLCDRVEVARVE